PWGPPPQGRYGYPQPPYQQGVGRAGQLAPWIYRVGASLIDGLILGVIGGILAAASLTQVGVYLFEALLSMAYTVILLGMRGQTVGMMAVGTRCVDATTGSLIGFPRAAARWLIAEVLGVTIIGGILDILWPLWDPRKQTLHDKVVNSLVIFAR
ncbi:MAG: RDD family protein, partial [Candidatus Dormibacteria bacterium]